MISRAFSLVELIIAIAIAGVMFLIAVPTMHDLVLQNRISARMNSIVSRLQYARSEAILLGEDVKFCKSRDSISCSGNWNDGQIVASSSGRVLRVFSVLPHGDSLIYKGGFGNNDYIEFSALGNVKQNGSFIYSFGDKNTVTKKIIINSVGRIRIG